MQTQCDYYIRMRDIHRLCWIVENNEICLDDNDAISVRLWVTQLQQAGGEATLKDKLDPPPPGYGLSPECFVLCFQTIFQRDQFQALGSNFLSIDATHNTTQYAGLQLFTLIVRDSWGQGTLCGADELGCLYLWDSAQTTTTALGSGRCEVLQLVTQASTRHVTRY